MLSGGGRVAEASTLKRGEGWRESGERRQQTCAPNMDLPFMRVCALSELGSIEADVGEKGRHQS